MSQPGINVQLSVKEIYEAVCLECRQKIRALIRAKISDQMVDQILGIPGGEKSEG